MKRKPSLRSWHRLASMYKRAMGRRTLPPVFHEAINRVISVGIHPKALRIRGLDGASHDLSRIVFSLGMKKTGYRGVYFSRRLEVSPEPDKIDWTTLGWDRSSRFMIFPHEEPEMWVVLHELGHYLDDVFFRMTLDELLSLGCTPFKADLFKAYRAEMRAEFEKAHGEAFSYLTKEQQDDPKWYRHVPSALYAQDAPSQYGLWMLSEWIAEAFRRYYMEREFLEARCPATTAFLDYALQGELFRRNSKPECSEWLSYFLSMTEDYAFGSAKN